MNRRESSASAVSLIHSSDTVRLLPKMVAASRNSPASSSTPPNRIAVRPPQIISSNPQLQQHYYVPPARSTPQPMPSGHPVTHRQSPYAFQQQQPPQKPPPPNYYRYEPTTSYNKLVDLAEQQRREMESNRREIEQKERYLRQNSHSNEQVVREKLRNTRSDVARDERELAQLTHIRRETQRLQGSNYEKLRQKENLEKTVAQEKSNLRDAVAKCDVLKQQADLLYRRRAAAANAAIAQQRMINTTAIGTSDSPNFASGSLQRSQVTSVDRPKASIEPFHIQKPSTDRSSPNEVIGLDQVDCKKVVEKFAPPPAMVTFRKHQENYGLGKYDCAPSTSSSNMVSSGVGTINSKNVTMRGRSNHLSLLLDRGLNNEQKSSESLDAPGSRLSIGRETTILGPNGQQHRDGEHSAVFV
ncbi:hypothetical protein QR680_005005 [Steinernema hermaphroditum]|uniref:Uncharacterized protein n=1 Tax=Steinernema hermaphroditum TaxID=289476 RepID=A0AA39HRY4_9BILA|nr:hypothetical protein QR680_005005 [Steinernema hermaphroditum]